MSQARNKSNVFQWVKGGWGGDLCGIHTGTIQSNKQEWTFDPYNNLEESQRNLVSGNKGSLVAQLVKNLPAMRETWVQSLGWEDPLEKGQATHSSILAWRILWTV